jgi:hypothetical protein
MSRADLERILRHCCAAGMFIDWVLFCIWQIARVQP